MNLNIWSYRNHLATLLFYFCISTGFSQNRVQFSPNSEKNLFRHLTVDDGLSQNMISAIHQDHRGFIWIGTKDGLNMYDGHSFRIYKYEPFNEYSISDNYVTVVYEDPLQRLWVGTLDGGLHYLDRETERFINFSSDSDDQNSISDNHINAIIGDSTGNIWIGTNGGGVNKLSFTNRESPPDKSNVEIMRFDGQVNGFSEQNARISTLFIDRQNHLWIGTYRGIFTIDISNSSAEFRKVDYLKNRKANPTEDMIARNRIVGAGTIFEDNNGNIWMGNAFGLFILDRDQDHFTAYESSDRRFPGTEVTALTSFVNQETGELWIAGERNIYVLNPGTGDFARVSNQGNQQMGSQRGGFTCLFADMGGTLWIGSDGNGISLYNPRAIKFNYPDDLIVNGRLLGLTARELSIRTFCESLHDSSTLWIGADEGLFKVNRKNSVIHSIRFHDLPAGQTTPALHIREDDSGLLWIGTEQGLVRLNPANNKYKLFPTGMSETGGISDPRVSFVHLGKEAVWILTSNTIARLDPDTEEFQHFIYNDENLDENSKAIFPSILEDRKGNFWIAARNGLHYFNIETLEITSHTTNFNHPNKYVISDISTIMLSPSDPERYLWFGTGSGGFSRFEIESGKLINYTEKDGLANNSLYGMLSDNEGNIWLSTNRGLSKFNIEKETFTNFTKADGLQSNEFNGGAYYKSLRGQLFYGGNMGYNCFFPSDIILRDFMAPIAFTGVEHYDENHLKVTDNSYSLWETGELKLKYNENHFTISFASLDYAFPENNTFAFSMTKSGTSWIEIGTDRRVTFTELKPGKYTLKVRGTNSDGVWSNKRAVLAIDIGRPWWQSIWAYLIYLLILVGTLYSWRRYELSRLKLKNQMRIAKIETNKLKELDQLKSQFFANISHEFRTPLTLIKGPLEQLINQNTDLQNKKTFRLMHNNTSKLLELINQLLDLSKIESGNYRLKAHNGNIIGFINGLTMSFASLSDQKKIILNVEIDPELENAEFRNSFYYDPDVLEKIINNLISNALKFTPENGRIEVKLSQIKEKENEGFMQIIINDTGIGIPADKLPHIFDRFYQVNKSTSLDYEGSGVGLAYVHELVKAHKGKIHVESQPGQGTVFNLRFPLGNSHLSTDEIIPDIPATPPDLIFPDTKLLDQILPDTTQLDGSIEYDPGNGNETNEKPWVLIVEDHDEVREYIFESIQNQYKVIQASNGTEGFTRAEEFIPDLIISDIMMPEMDGCEFCQKVKSSEKTSHIPVILLTAKADVNDRITGLETGADDYLLKPFNAEELRIRIKNLIDNRRALRQKFSTNSIITPGEISVTPRDASFMEMLLSLVDKNMANIDFSVEDLGKEAGMSQSQLHRKLKAIVNMSANQFIRSVRMQRAMELLQNSGGNISEIAFMVGYDDPGYFSKSFRKFHGKLPSEVLIRS